MIGIYVAIPITCFRKGMAREYLETEEIPSPATCYGFLLSLAGETDRCRHVGARVSCSLVRSAEQKSVVLRTVWRVKNRPLGSPGNMRPDYQQLLTGVELVVWLDSSNEDHAERSLEDRVRGALDPNERNSIDRFGGLSLGESTHLVDEVRLLERESDLEGRLFRVAERGRVTLPVWVDHVGSSGTRYACGDLTTHRLAETPTADMVPTISPE